MPGNAVLQITYIGYVQQDVAVKNRDQLAVLLKEDTKTLDEVVVVGYGTMKKKDLTGAVASVKMDDTPKYDIYSEPCVSRKKQPVYR